MKDIFTYVQELWEWLNKIQDWSTAEGWLARAVVWFCAVTAILFLLKNATEWVLQIKSSLMSLGWRPGLSPEERAKIRRRRQFCEVLRSDLATLSKAEAWNDQFFTDLEAQIEAEGKFYASNLDRLMRRKSTGLRRVRSLIRAIETSAEQFQLLIGEAGSGKSVALRHFANQLANRAIRSQAENVPIPLYINLKELPPAPPEGPSADSIKRFVLENIRRGDADTADYVRENWNEYRDLGVWFFLFDSFDEIPEILHAPTGSRTINKYTEAIRQFLAGMSTCRGVIASREFKGPNELPWHKLRILPLSPERQEELVDNMFLPPEKKRTIAQHLAAQGSSLRNHPLFLSLLCRHVKEVGQAPHSDFDLLDRHIDRLAERDTDFVLASYNITSQQIIEGAMYLARLFAETPQISLSPTLDEISRASNGDTIPGGNLENFLMALVYIKLGRSDVQGKRSGEKRFTFAHRRYQEALFVRYLARNPTHLSATELLTNPRWREYAVTLLQTQAMADVSPILHEAKSILQQCQVQEKLTPVLPEFGSSFFYHNWGGYLSVYVLNILQEGLARRIADVPLDLQAQVDLLLIPRWSCGDFHDRENVLKVCGLLSQPELTQILLQAIETGTTSMLGLVFQKTTFLSCIPEALADWTRRQLSNEILQAPSKEEILRLDALIARLPDSIGASVVFRRNLQLKKTWAWRFGSEISSLLRTGVAHQLKIKKRSIAANIVLQPPKYFFEGLLNYQLIIGLAFLFASIQSFVAEPVVLSQKATAFFAIIIGSSMIFVGALHQVRHAFRSLGSELTIRTIKADLVSWYGRTVTRMMVIFVSIFISLALYFLHLLETEGIVRLSTVALATVGLPTLMLIALREYRKGRNASSTLSHWSSSKCPMALILHANSADEALLWMDEDPNAVMPSAAHVRSFGALVVGHYSPLVNFLHNPVCIHGKAPLILLGTSKSASKKIGESLEDLLRKKS